MLLFVLMVHVRVELSWAQSKIGTLNIFLVSSFDQAELQHHFKWCGSLLRTKFLICKVKIWGLKSQLLAELRIGLSFSDQHFIPIQFQTR